MYTITLRKSVTYGDIHAPPFAIYASVTNPPSRCSWFLTIKTCWEVFHAPTSLLGFCFIPALLTRLRCIHHLHRQRKLPGLSAQGTITTDGNFGTLTSADILDYDLTVSNGLISASFAQGGSFLPAQVSGTDLTATSSALFFQLQRRRWLLRARSSKRYVPVLR
jgi:hypothetical protein